MASEGTNIWLKVGDSGQMLSEPQRWRVVLNWLASILGFGVVIGLFLKFHPAAYWGPPQGEWGIWPMHYAQIALLTIALLFVLPSLVLRIMSPSHGCSLPCFRGEYSDSHSAVDYGTGKPIPLDLNRTEPFSVLFLAIGSAMTAMSDSSN